MKKLLTQFQIQEKCVCLHNMKCEGELESSQRYSVTLKVAKMFLQLGLWVPSENETNTHSRTVQVALSELTGKPYRQ